jgi:prephenate dehydrogenase
MPSTAAAHDRAVAAVSHLPYVVASALALTALEAGPLALRLAGRGLLDATRLASFDSTVQGEAARRNASLPRASRSFERHLRRLLETLEVGRRNPSSTLLRARAARESLVRRIRPRD